MRDRDLFQALSELGPKLLTIRGPERASLIERAVELKLAVVEADTREADLRMQLNFGHTVGHAVEAHSGHEISHGSAVAMGMIHELKMIGELDSAPLQRLLRSIGQPLALPEGLGEEELARWMRLDKKATGGHLRIAAPKAWGVGAVYELAHGQRSTS